MLDVAIASQLARLPLKYLRRELPHKLDHVLRDLAELRRPKEAHPAFYGCFDWHSAVHGHWMLARLRRAVPALPEADAIAELFDDTLAPDHVAVEARYLDDHPAFERTYGWAWLLELATELATTRWSVEPIAAIVRARYLAFLPKQAHPIRAGVHANTAFGLALALDHARAGGHATLEALVVERARTYFGADADAPASWEPGGDDFLSPALVEADLMRRVLAPDELAAWLRRFLPRGLPPALETPVEVTDRSDAKLAHGDGLNLSRAWCLRRIAAALPAEDAAPWTAAANRHAAAGLAHVATGDYAGEHWLASFATYLLT